MSHVEFTVKNDLFLMISHFFAFSTDINYFHLFFELGNLINKHEENN